jgi:hypothetical protein
MESETILNDIDIATDSYLTKARKLLSAAVSKWVSLEEPKEKEKERITFLSPLFFFFLGVVETLRM